MSNPKLSNRASRNEGGLQAPSQPLCAPTIEEMIASGELIKTGGFETACAELSVPRDCRGALFPVDFSGFGDRFCSGIVGGGELALSQIYDYDINREQALTMMTAHPFTAASLVVGAEFGNDSWARYFGLLGISSPSHREMIQRLYCSFRDKLCSISSPAPKAQKQIELRSMSLDSYPPRRINNAGFHIDDVLSAEPDLLSIVLTLLLDTSDATERPHESGTILLPRDLEPPKLKRHRETGNEYIGSESPIVLSD